MFNCNDYYQVTILLLLLLINSNVSFASDTQSVMNVNTNFISNDYSNSDNNDQPCDDSDEFLFFLRKQWKFI